MAHWIQRIFLKLFVVSLSVAFTHPVNAKDDSTQQGMNELNNEQFELGLSAGFLNIQDFGSEIATGLHANFIATENTFLQLNYVFTSTSESSYETNQGPLFSGDDRDFKHLDFLVGYNLYQGEQFFSGSKAQLSSLYIIAGVGDTSFGGEERFTYVAGVGYQVGLSRTLNLKFDYRNYIYDSSLLEEDESTVNTLFSVGVSYLF
ncbi:outer membrane beta-barrel domain-containing protein [Pleionea sediminis]|uniref:outer membrane beta-barrel domain-containing protein n=1 Tax=Pleionea sediminis TaxID=2569479 RepID=UPI00118647B3|nr:outer membrane beta-barrel domain-containing protein [Pleionea sediminis]